MHNHQKEDTIPTSTDKQMDEQNRIQPYSEILPSRKKEWCTETLYTVTKPWKYHAEWKKPETQGRIICDQFLWNVQNMQIQRQKVE